MGASAIQKRLETFDLGRGGRPASNHLLRLRPAKARPIKRLKVINAFVATGSPPASMVLTKIPAGSAPPWFSWTAAAFPSDLNDLHRRVINRSTRLSVCRAGCPRIISATRSACFRSPLTPSSTTVAV